MKYVNLFEQQALQQQSLRPVSNDAVLRGVLGLIDGASLETCRDIAAKLSVRLFALEKQHSGMKASNLNEAAHFIADAVRDIQGAIIADDEQHCACGKCDTCIASRSDEQPCTCGKCDSCVAARSDEHYDRQRDAQDVLAASREAAGRAA